MNTRQSSRKGDTLVYEGEVGQIPAQEAEQRTETDVWKTNKQSIYPHIYWRQWLTSSHR